MSHMQNLLLNTDSYKQSHYKQYPSDTLNVFSYIEARGTKVPGVREIVTYGLQMFIKQWLLRPITRQDIEQAALFCQAHGLDFNREGWEYILSEHQGFIPVTIKAVPEGTPVPLGNAIVTIEATDEKCGFAVSFLETALLRAVWYPSTVATLSRECKRIIKSYLDETSDTADAELHFKLHDFGARGVSSFESAGIGGSAHLINFKGSDTITGILFAMEYYNADVCGFSINASEHSTMTAEGREGEKSAYQRMIDAYARPGSMFAVVSDSYDIMNAVQNIWAGDGLLEQVKQKGATVVIRPDSGDPTIVPVDIIEWLCDNYGHTVNSKGYKVLPDHVRVIQGDGITIETIPVILENMKKRGLSASNIAFGMGGGLLQKCDRDTFKWAMKCCARLTPNGWVDVYKDPITDQVKKSKRGRLALVKRRGEFETVRVDMLDRAGIKHEDINLLVPVYHCSHGVMTTKFYTYDEVRANATL